VLLGGLRAERNQRHGDADRDPRQPPPLTSSEVLRRPAAEPL
jgi:hypothetical protein